MKKAIIAAAAIYLTAYMTAAFLNKGTFSLAYVSAEYGWRCHANGRSLEECRDRIRRVIEANEEVTP